MVELPWTMADTWELLAYIQTFDDRNFQEAHALSWNSVALNGRWTRELVLEAVRDHYMNSTDTLLPAHVHAYVRDRKQDESMREYDRPTPGQPVTGNVAKFIARNWLSEEEMEIALLEVECPFEGCRVPKSQPCNLGGYMAGRRKRHMPHPGRHYALEEKARQYGLDPTWDGPECPTCGAPAGLRCMNLGRGSYMSGRTNPHPDRLKVAA